MSFLTMSADSEGNDNRIIASHNYQWTCWMKKFFFPFCVILNLENFYDDERQQCREFGYFTYKHILMKVLPGDFEIMINVFTRSI